MSERAQRLLGALAILALTALAYHGVLDLGFIWDDPERITRNETLRSAEGLRQIWLDVAANKQYYPLVFTSFWIEYQLWQLDPTGYHVVNVLLHALGSILAWRVLAFLGLPGAWVAGALFALHPVHVESVAWVTERKNVLSGVFYLASARLYLGCALDPGRRAADWRYAASLLLFLCALWSKTVTCTLPAALLLVLWWKQGRVARRDLLALTPFFALGVGFGLLTAWLERHEVGATGFDWAFSPVERVLIAGRVVWFYLGKLIWPEPLIFFYPRWQIDDGVWWQYVYPVAAIATVVALWRLRDRLGRGPLVAFLFFGGTLFPALGFFDVYPMRFSFVADHFQYLASLGPIALAAGAGVAFARERSPGPRRVAAVLLALLLVVYGALVARRVPVYEGLETLWRDTIAENPGAFLAHYNLGNLVRRRGEVDAAREHYRLAIAANPRYEMAYNNLATVLAQQGRREEAIATYRQALELMPDYALGHFNLAALLLENADADGAIAQFSEILRRAPENGEAHYGLARALTLAGRPEEAHPHYVAARRLGRSRGGDPEEAR